MFTTINSAQMIMINTPRFQVEGALKKSQKLNFSHLLIALPLKTHFSEGYLAEIISS